MSLKRPQVALATDHDTATIERLFVGVLERIRGWSMKMGGAKKTNRRALVRRRNRPRLATVRPALETIEAFVDAARCRADLGLGERPRILRNLGAQFAGATRQSPCPSYARGGEVRRAGLTTRGVRVLKKTTSLLPNESVSDLPVTFARARGRRLYRSGARAAWR
jgi:hypothetical protein